MAATVNETSLRPSAAVRGRLFYNTVTAVGGSETTVLEKCQSEGFTRFTIQLQNTDGSVVGVAKVYGSIRDASAGGEGGTDWVQIGDDISVAANSSALKAISTTPLRQICVRATGNGADLTCHLYGEQG